MTMVKKDKNYFDEVALKFVNKLKKKYEKNTISKRIPNPFSIALKLSEGLWVELLNDKRIRFDDKKFKEIKEKIFKAKEKEYDKINNFTHIVEPLQKAKKRIYG